MANRFKLVFIIVEKFSPVSLSKRVACKYRLQRYETLCSGYVWVLYDSSKRFAFGTKLKKTTNSFKFEFKILFDIRNDDSYPTLKRTVIQIEKQNRCDHFHSYNKC